MIDLMNAYVAPAAFALLPPELGSREARAFVLAIGLQESEYVFRVQRRGGPARGFWQFERAGVGGVLAHGRSRECAQAAMTALRYEGASTSELLEAITHNDVLAFVFARLLIYTLPAQLPTANAPSAAWRQYLDAWCPGAPRPDDWPKNYRRAWEVVGR